MYRLSLRGSALAALLLCAGVSVAQVFHLADDFSATQNGGANPWSYGSTTTIGGAFTAFTVQTAGPWISASTVGWNGEDTFNGTNTGLPYYPFILKNTSPSDIVFDGNAGPGSNLTLPAGKVFFHGSSARQAVIRLTVPTGAGNVYNGSVTFRRLQTASTSYSQFVAVQKNASTLDSIFLSGNGSSVTFNLNSLPLMEGDTLDFLVAADPDDSGGTIGVEAEIQAVPEPASLLAFGLGAAALRRRARRTR